MTLLLLFITRIIKILCFCALWDVTVKPLVEKFLKWLNKKKADNLAKDRRGDKFDQILQTNAWRHVKRSELNMF